MKAPAAIRFEFQSRRCRCKTLSEVSSRSGKNCFYSVPTWPTFFSEPSVHHLILSTTITMITLLKRKPGVVLCIKKNILAYIPYRICRYLSDLSQILSNLHYQIHQIYLHDYLLDGPRSDGITGHACRLRMENIGGLLTVLLTKDCAHGGIHRWAMR